MCVCMCVFVCNKHPVPDTTQIFTTIFFLLGNIKISLQPVKIPKKLTDMFILSRGLGGAMSASKRKSSSNIEFVFTVSVRINIDSCRLTEKWGTSAFDLIPL